MPNQKLVRCNIRRSGVSGDATPRFVPLEIFGLWEFLMAAKHGFEVLEAKGSLWLDLEDTPEAAYGANQYERVTELTAFVFSSRDEMFAPVRRYFPTVQCEELKRIFLAHYPESQRMQTRVQERPGIWLRRDATEAAAL
ncbi:MAG: hypothetical protein HOP12_03115 [Candidatus Eisenbacteria bacterium]|uniref:Uncharacterized protein n=1 Tax=Eiseniibacteriota bacterium TaxID=2212470 RepID=A0A849SP10_UNCEI|nr:hypothetical protein [Candidatus Eisenbacteria bacterium]